MGTNRSAPDEAASLIKTTAAPVANTDATALRAENAALRARLAELEHGSLNVGDTVSVEQIVLRTLAEACPFRIFAKDTQGRIIFGNTEMARSVGLTLTQLIGKTDFDFFPESLAAMYSSDEQALFNTGQALIEKEEPTVGPVGGEPLWTLTSKVPLRDRDGKIIGLVGIGLDLTGRKRLEQELRQSNAELIEANRKLVETRKQLIQSEKLAALGALVAGIAHELNTPIGNSLMLASLLKDDTVKLTASLVSGLGRSQLTAFLEKTGEAAEILMRSLQHAADLVSSFKQVAVDRTSVQRRKFGLREVFDEILLTLEPGMRRTPHKVVCTIPPGINMDSYPGPLGQVVSNLINNAVLHAFEGRRNGRIDIGAELLSPDQVRIAVRDDGIGIKEINLARVFDPFFTTKLGQGGSGLGLSIVHSLVSDILGGRIEVSSKDGQGACFTLTLPLVAPNGENPITTAASSVPPSKLIPVPRSL